MMFRAAALGLIAIAFLLVRVDSFNAIPSYRTRLKQPHRSYTPQKQLVSLEIQTAVSSSLGNEIDIFAQKSSDGLAKLTNSLSMVKFNDLTTKLAAIFEPITESIIPATTLGLLLVLSINHGIKLMKVLLPLPKRNSQLLSIFNLMKFFLPKFPSFQWRRPSIAKKMLSNLTLKSSIRDTLMNDKNTVRFKAKVLHTFRTLLPDVIQQQIVHALSGFYVDHCSLTDAISSSQHIPTATLGKAFAEIAYSVLATMIETAAMLYDHGRKDDCKAMLNSLAKFMNDVESIFVSSFPDVDIAPMEYCGPVDATTREGLFKTMIEFVTDDHIRELVDLPDEVLSDRIMVQSILGISDKTFMQIQTKLIEEFDKGSNNNIPIMRHANAESQSLIPTPNANNIPNMESKIPTFPSANLFGNLKLTENDFKEMEKLLGFDMKSALSTLSYKDFDPKAFEELGVNQNVLNGMLNFIGIK